MIRNYTDFHFAAKQGGIKQAIYASQVCAIDQHKLHHWIRLYESTPQKNLIDFCEKIDSLVENLAESGGGKLKKN